MPRRTPLLVFGLWDGEMLSESGGRAWLLGEKGGGLLFIARNSVNIANIITPQNIGLFELRYWQKRAKVNKFLITNFLIFFDFHNL